MELEDADLQAASRDDARESRGDHRNANNNDNPDEERRDGADRAVARPKNENHLKRQASSTGTNRTDATGAARAQKRRRRSEESGSTSNRTRRNHHHRRRRHHHHRDARRREEERVCRQQLERIRSLDQRRSTLLAINEGVRRDNAVVGGIIAAVNHLPNERNPLLQLLLAQHILHETHRYTLKLLQDEVFTALRQELAAERPREYILQRLVLPDNDDDDDDENASSETDLDQLVNVLRVLPLDQLIRLLKPPSRT